MATNATDTIYKLVKAKLVAFIKGKFITAALKKILGASVGGIQGIVVQYILSKLFEEIARPLIEASIRQGFFYAESINGKIKYKVIERKRTGGNAEDYFKEISNS